MRASSVVQPGSQRSDGLEIDRLSEFVAFKDLTVDDYKMILSEAEKLAVNVIAPTLPVTDKDAPNSWTAR